MDRGTVGDDMMNGDGDGGYLYVGEVDGVVSEDSDAILFGAESVYRYFLR